MLNCVNTILTHYIKCTLFFKFGVSDLFILITIFSLPSVFVRGIGSRNSCPYTEICGAQVPYIKWCNTVSLLDPQVVPVQIQPTADGNFNLWLVEYADVKLKNTECWLYSYWKKIQVSMDPHSLNPYFSRASWI